MRKTGRIINLTTEYLRWNIRSWQFPAIVLLYSFILFVSIYDDYTSGSNEGVFYFLQLAYISKFQAIAPMICAIPSALNYSREKHSGSFYYIYSRTGKINYTLSLCVSSFLTAFLVATLSSIIFMGILALRYPMTGGNIFALESCIESVSNGGLIASGQYLLFYVVTVATKASFLGMMTVITVFVSVLISDTMLSTVAPLVIYVIVCDAMIRLDASWLINPSYVFNSGNYNIRSLQPEAAGNFSVISCIYPFIYALICSSVSTLLTHIALLRNRERKV